MRRGRARAPSLRRTPRVPRTPRRAPGRRRRVDAKRGHRASRASRGSNLRELEALAGSVAGGRGAAGSVAGAERFAAIEKELQALASRAGVGDGSPLSALVDPESSDEEETPVTK